MQPKIKLILLVILIPTSNFFSQTNTTSAIERLNENSLRAQSIYFELGGNGLLFSVNYDFRFNKSQKGLGMRLGLGYYIYDIIFSSVGSVSIPIAINHLAGNAPHYFESGIGFTYINNTSKGFISGILPPSSSVQSKGSAFVPSIGYRYQPNGNGFLGRIVFSPLISLNKDGEPFLPWVGVGLGYQF